MQLQDSDRQPELFCVPEATGRRLSGCGGNLQDWENGPGNLQLLLSHDAHFISYSLTGPSSPELFCVIAFPSHYTEHLSSLGSASKLLLPLKYFLRFMFLGKVSSNRILWGVGEHLDTQLSSCIQGYLITVK